MLFFVKDDSSVVLIKHLLSDNTGGPRLARFFGPWKKPRYLHEIPSETGLISESFSLGLKPQRKMPILSPVHL